MGDLFDPTELTFEEILSLEDDVMDKLLEQYNAYKEERVRYQHEAFIALPEKPALVMDAIHYLRVHNAFEKEGIFRVNGDSKTVDTIRKAYVNTVDTDDILRRLEQEETLNCFDVATALKSYFRLLESPLVPFDNYERMKDIVEESTEREKHVNGIKQELAQIAEPNLSILCYVMKFFQEVIEKVDVNKMSANNMATCLTMSITRFIPEAGSTSHLAAMLEVGLSTKIIGIMLAEIDFNEFISVNKYFELLKATNYRKELLPENVNEFKGSTYASLFPGLNNERPALPPRNRRKAPVVPPRARKGE